MEKYADRIEIISPGLPPEPITLRKIEQLDYIACSRNPNLARGLSFFERIEEQGDGLRRIVRECEAIGLPRPRFRFRDGHFEVVFFGPEDMLKLRSQRATSVFEVPASVLADLSETLRTIIQRLMERQTMKVPELANEMSVTPQAIRKAIKPLLKAGLVSQEGKARDRAYRLREAVHQ